MVIRARARSPLVLGRFAGDPTAGVGSLGPGRWKALSIPAGRVSRGWRATSPTARRLTVCRLSPSEGAREEADQSLAASIGLTLRLAQPPTDTAGCRTSARPRGALVFALARGGALIRASASSGLLVGRRAAAPTAGIGFLGAGRWEELRIPGGRVSRGWAATAPTARRLTVCRLAAG
jgi:hypothetical protein